MYVSFKVLVGQDHYLQNIHTYHTGDSNDGFLENKNAFAVDVEKCYMASVCWMVQNCAINV
jgi:hypothetical protein